jgi:toxin ParE1/3/4
VKAYEVALSPLAEGDLNSLYDWIADGASPAIAKGFILRIRASLESLSLFPERGTRRDHVVPGVRVYGLDRRVTIAFRVDANTVTILRVLYGGRDLAGLLDDAGP